ncbi:inositol 1,4,5-trisphosphate receptor type 2-like isoform X2 [Lineus longissimus]|uniref:inositol 1,4,5-trisphosphate receptor type 2-like isoform X2 n=1 Tax=Lineus longissimus TaxID=88925 RepID=UPI00315CB1B2
MAPTGKQNADLSQNKDIPIRRCDVDFARPPPTVNKGTEVTSMGDFLCIGDYICLYCVGTDGYIFSYQSSCVHNGLYIYQQQDRETPAQIPNPHAVTFQVCIQNRYKLNKKYRKIYARGQRDDNDIRTKAQLPSAKMSAEAENNDNIAEQKRQHGKRVRYGEIIQLKHVYTGKYIHVSTTQGSVRDKNNMLVSLHDYNAKHAQFRVQPRYKVKSEGDNVQIYDQIVLESVKSVGQYFHASMPWQIDYDTFGSELNLGIERTGFTLIKTCKPILGDEEFVKGGSVIRLYHRELEAYLITEGLFGDEVLQNVHLRVRQIDQINKPKTLMPSTSGLTYWQVEAEDSILNGNVIRWGQQIRLRHMVTRRYLCVNSDLEVDLTTDHRDPRAVFRLHPVKKEVDEIKFESYARIEHELTGRWLHALKDVEYVPREKRLAQFESLRGIECDEAQLHEISTECDQQYDDAFSLQQCMQEHVSIFNYVAGTVPFIKNLIADLTNGKTLHAVETHRVTEALTELTNFLYVTGLPEKPRQKLLRNLRVLDLLMELLKFPLRGTRHRIYLTSIFKKAYDVLHAYMAGNSRKNALYMAKYMGFFYTQLNQRGDIGLNVAQMVMELIKDNRKVVDRLSHTDIDIFVSLLKKNKNYRYLDMLNVLCVCDGVALPENQNYITQKWLCGDRDGVYLVSFGADVPGWPASKSNILYITKDNGKTRSEVRSFCDSGIILTDLGLNIGRETRRDIIYVSLDGGNAWNLLYEFCDHSREEFSEEDYQFLVHQLDLLGKICYGGNVSAIEKITEELKLLTWEQAFYCMKQELLPEALRAQYCSLIIGLFVDIGMNRTATDHISLAFVYEDVGNVGSIKKYVDSMKSEVSEMFPSLRDWITAFLEENKGMIAAHPGHNLLIAQVLRLVQFLVEYGYYGDSNDIRQLMQPLINLLDGRNDKPVSIAKSSPNFMQVGLSMVIQEVHKFGKSKETEELLKHFQTVERYEPSPEARAIVEVKLQAMEVLDLLFTFQYHSALEGFVSMFKYVERKARMKQRHGGSLSGMLYETFEQTKEQMTCRKALKKLEDLFDKVSYFDAEQITDILMDLSNYKYDEMVTKSVGLMNKYYSARAHLFRRAVHSQVLITEESKSVYKEAQKNIPVLRRLTKARLNEEQAQQMDDIFDKLAEFCHLKNKKDRPHPMNQTILINHGILSVIFDLLAQHNHCDLTQEKPEVRDVVKKALRCLMFLANGNDHVQKRTYERLDMLMNIKGVEQELSLCLRQAFIGSESLCLKIQPQMIERIVKLAAEQREKAPALLELLRTLVKVEDLDLPLKRNQMYVIKYIMHNYHQVAYVIDQPREMKEKILCNEYGAAHLRYMVCLVDLLATCAEGENRFIESLCQKFIKIDDLFWVLNHPNIDNNLKSPFLKYLLWAYMNTAGSIIESGAAELPHESATWEYLAHLVTEVNALTVYIIEQKDSIEQLLIKPPSISQVADPENLAEKMRSNLHYMFDGVMPFLQVFFRKFYSVDKELYPEESPIVDKFAHALMVFSEAIGFLISNPTHMRTLVSCALSVVPQSTLPARVLEDFLEKFGSGRLDLKETSDEVAYQEYTNYYCEEEELNAKLHTYAVNYRQVYGGANTVAAQLKHAPPKAAVRPYTEMGGDEELPLGEEFQNFIQCFIKAHSKSTEEKYERAGKLLDQLVISFSQSRHTDKKRLDQEELDIKCLQLLRGMIHNEERKLPENWDESKQKTKTQLTMIKELQNAFNQKEALWKVLPHVARQNDMLVKEVLGFMSAMLFNANNETQRSMHTYFMSTREENFFLAMKIRMQMSATAAKEKRALISQHKAKAQEAIAHAKSLQATMTQGRVALQRLQNAENARRMKRLRRTMGHHRESMFQKSGPGIERKTGSSLLKYKSKEEKMPLIKENQHRQGVDDVVVANGKMKQVSFEGGIDNQRFEMAEIKVDTMPPAGPGGDQTTPGEPGRAEADESQDLHYRDDGYIELVLKVLSRMCDGQFRSLQHYLREQPDNIKSFNLIAETVQYMSQVYANINPNSINLIYQLLDSLNECVSGNEENRVVIFDNKIVDYINFILRTGQFGSCELEKALQLLEIIGDLLMSLIEENQPDALEIAREVADCLDKEALLRFMTECYNSSRPPEQSQFAKARKLKEAAIQQTMLLSRKSKAQVPTGDLAPKTVLPRPEDGLLTNDMKETMVTVGFKYFFLLRRIMDISPRVTKTGLTEQQLAAYNFYDKNSMSVETLKDGHLQKLRFRVENKNVLRNEVKEKLKWEVDRSSPSSKIRDLMCWSKDILKDIIYQRKVLNNRLAFFFMKFWLFWNYAAIFLSLAINVLMLVTWNAMLSLDQVVGSSNMTALPAAIYDPMPNITFDHYREIKYTFAGVHNLVSLFVVISFFLLNHPQFPEMPRFLHNCCGLRKDEPDEVMKKRKSKLETRFFSFKTLYYLLFLGFSIAGTAYTEYFFCFHLLNIVNNNQLLSRVISAVTLNGKSLLWVGVLGVVIFYIYALIAFAFFRPTFDPSQNWYCKNLFQCFVTIIRYGLIGDMFEGLRGHGRSSGQNMPIHDSEANFERFGMYVLFNVSFFIFITTIGLNIIFGIIVDTFSELRDLKWTAEKDMRDCCFVCSRISYDFEHYGKGFQHHCKYEHNMWSYIFFFIHLADTKPNDYTALELHVYKLLQKENYDFFPLNRALCLTDMENDQAETKFDELLHYVSSIFHKQKEEELRKKQEEERLKQKKWEEEHRRMFYGNGDPPEPPVDPNWPAPPLALPPTNGKKPTPPPASDPAESTEEAEAPVEINFDDGDEMLDPFKQQIEEVTDTDGTAEEKPEGTEPELGELEDVSDIEGAEGHEPADDASAVGSGQSDDNTSISDRSYSLTADAEVLDTESTLSTGSYDAENEPTGPVTRL